MSLYASVDEVVRRKSREGSSDEEEGSQDNEATRQESRDEVGTAVGWDLRWGRGTCRSSGRNSGDWGAGGNLSAGGDTIESQLLQCEM